LKRAIEYEKKLFYFCDLLESIENNFKDPLISYLAIMKEKELYVDFKAQQSIYYVEKDDASYGPIVSGSYLSKNYLSDFFEKRKKQELSLREQLKKGKISPVYYYLVMQEYGEKDLASRAGVSVRKLKQHCKMENFVKMPLKVLKKYADAFDIPVVNFFHLLIAKQESAGKFTIQHMETDNPYFVVTKIDEAKK